VITMSTSQVAVDQFRRVRGSGIHDATIQAFSLIAGGQFEVFLRNPGGQEKRVVLSEIAQFGFRDFVNGAIVSDIFCWKLNDPTIALESMCDAWRVLLGGNYAEPDFLGLVSAMMQRYASALLVFFECSYGGSIAAICRDLQV